ncbi:MAG TPA: hypothetical protein ENI20_18830 [Bacteroides sp.]|nr:hypothetical protein [Bacteroides sp.]
MLQRQHQPGIIPVIQLTGEGDRKDKWVKGLLDQLEQDGLTDNTIVFFYSDHGDGLPWGKHWIHATGTRVPMIIYLPEKYRDLSRLFPGSGKPSGRDCDPFFYDY